MEMPEILTGYLATTQDGMFASSKGPLMMYTDPSPAPASEVPAFAPGDRTTIGFFESVPLAVVQHFRSGPFMDLARSGLKAFELNVPATNVSFSRPGYFEIQLGDVPPDGITKLSDAEMLQELLSSRNPAAIDLAKLVICQFPGALALLVFEQADQKDTRIALSKHPAVKAHLAELRQLRKTGT